MRILITGASGFVGRYVALNLDKRGHRLFLTSPVPFHLRLKQGLLKSVQVNLCHFPSAKKLLSKIKPDAVVHLAALSHIGKSWVNRSEMVKVNVEGTNNLCRALKTNKKPVTFLYVSTATVYGGKKRSQGRYTELDAPDPRNPYAASKLAGENIVRCYASDTFRPYIVRPGNHTGPGQSTDYVVPAFAQRIFKTPDNGVISVGNLKSKRDFMDVRDVADAYRRILEKKPKDNLFVLGSGREIAISEILKRLIKISGKKIKSRLDPSILRPQDKKTIFLNPARARKVLGWKCRTQLQDTLVDIYRSPSFPRRRG